MHVYVKEKHKNSFCRFLIGKICQEDVTSISRKLVFMHLQRVIYVKKRGLA